MPSGDNVLVPHMQVVVPLGPVMLLTNAARCAYAQAGRRTNNTAGLPLCQQSSKAVYQRNVKKAENR